MSFFYAGIVAGTAVVAAAAVEGYRRWALGRQLLDHPNERSSHGHPVPRGAGVIIALGTLVSVGLAAGLSSGGAARGPVGYLGGGLAVAAVSWLDDIQSLSARTRLMVHGVAAVLLVAATGVWTSGTLPFSLTVQIGEFGGVVLSIIWIVGLTNAFNFMDGIDGIAAGQAIVAGLGWMLIGADLGAPIVMAMAVAIVGCSAGFLVHNWSPARVFMGDVGSAFLGYTFAALPLLSRTAAPDSPLAARLPVLSALFVWPFLFDTLVTLAGRLVRREPVMQAHRSHCYQRLVLGGWSHASVAALYIGLAVTGGLLALGWWNELTGIDWAVVAVPAILGVVLARAVGRVERRGAVATTAGHG